MIMSRTSGMKPSTTASATLRTGRGMSGSTTAALAMAAIFSHARSTPLDATATPLAFRTVSSASPAARAAAPVTAPTAPAAAALAPATRSSPATFVAVAPPTTRPGPRPGGPVRRRARGPGGLARRLFGLGEESLALPFASPHGLHARPERCFLSPDAYGSLCRG